MEEEGRDGKGKGKERKRRGRQRSIREGKRQLEKEGEEMGGRRLKGGV